MNASDPNTKDPAQQQPMSSKAEPDNKKEDEQLARHFGQSLATKIAMIVLRLIRNAILARVLGPADRGLFSLISSLPELIMTAGNAGLSNAVAYNTAKQTRPFRHILANANTLILIIGMTLFGLSFWLVEQPWLVKDYHDVVNSFNWVIAIAIPIMLLKIVNTNALNVLQRISTVNLISLMESLIPLILFLVLWWIFDVEPLVAAVSAWMVGLVTLAVFSIWQLKQGVRLEFDTDLQKQLLGFGGRGYFDTLFQKLLLRVDFLFVSAMIGSEALSYYAMATAAAELLLTIPDSLMVPFFAFFLRKSAQDKNAVTPIVMRLMVTTMIVGAIFFALSGKILIWILFGEAFLPAYGPLLCLLPGVVFLSYCSLIRLDLLGHNMPGTVSLVSGSAVLINILFNFILIPTYGVNGAAIAASIAYAVAAFGLYLVHSRLTGLSAVDTLILRPSDITLALDLLKRLR